MNSMADEYLEVVDEANRVIGQEKRRVIHRYGLWHRGVHVFLFTPDRKLLIQQRSEGQDTFPGTLDCSVSEHLAIGEAYRDGAMRGLREELGIESVHLQRLLRLKMNYGPGDNMINELYEGVYEREALTINQREVARIIYYTILELEEMMALGQVLLTPWFTQLLRWYTGKPTRLQVLWACR
jgi:isopentenyl-diphosphate delta-isomerase type 1